MAGAMLTHPIVLVQRITGSGCSSGNQVSSSNLIRAPPHSLHRGDYLRKKAAKVESAV